jgi:hypothetical protein
MPDPGSADDPATGDWAKTVPGATDCDAGAAVITVLTLSPAALAASRAWLAPIPTTFGTDILAFDAGGVPTTPWQDDCAVGVAVGTIPGSIGAAVLVDGAEAISSQTNAPGTALLPAGSDWLDTDPGEIRADAGGTPL